MTSMSISLIKQLHSSSSSNFNSLSLPQSTLSTSAVYDHCQTFQLFGAVSYSQFSLVAVLYLRLVFVFLLSFGCWSIMQYLYLLWLFRCVWVWGYRSKCIYRINEKSGSRFAIYSNFRNQFLYLIILFDISCFPCWFIYFLDYRNDKALIFIIFFNISKG